MSLTLSPAMVERVLRRCEEVLAGVGMEATPFVVDWYNDFRLEVAADMPQLIEVSGRNRLGVVCVSNKDFFRTVVRTAITEEPWLGVCEKSLVLDVSWAAGGIELWGQVRFWGLTGRISEGDGEAQRKFDFVAEASDDVGRDVETVMSNCLEPLQKRFSDPNATEESIDNLVEEFLTGVKEGDYKERGFNDSMYSMYGLSKLALIAWTKVLAREAMADPRKILVTGCCPGWCRTDSSNHTGRRSAETGAKVVVWLAAEVDYDPTMSGKLYRDNQEFDWQTGNLLSTGEVYSTPTGTN
ncbi:hypothetical protein FOZ60_006178 [Perkinsus olseni]|uniref:Carbonyl reductase 1 n=1 Tax=Perkinsus olseni TaxID=32597 RepID=A0A7J6NPG1_PEROL|nr:hypothetical protein FOZ60_006178 [Perkinsus olseni]